MTTKVITYRRADDGGTSICRPALGDRRVKAITVGGKRIEIDPPTPIDRYVVAYRTTDLSPEWAESEDDFLRRVIARSVPPDATDVRLVDERELPTDRTYRAALKPDLSYDMDRARDVHRARIRAARAPLLAKLDVSYQRADEAGDLAAKKEIARLKKLLRDAPADASIVSARSIADLSALPLPDESVAVLPAPSAKVAP